jgi:tetratricopeptide (TPR) repeat protein
MNRKFQVILLSAFVLAGVSACKKNPPSQENIDIQQLQAQVETALEEKRLDDARGVCQKMQEIQPGYPPTYYYLGTIEKTEGNYEEAAEYFEKYIELTPDQAKGYNTLGMMLFDIREYDMAIEQVSEAIRIDPGLGQSYINLGRIYARKGKYKKALEIFEKARQFNPDEKELNRQIKIMNDYQGYIKGLLDEVKRSPNLDLPLYGIARFYHLQGKYKQAKDYCIRAYNSKETNPRLRKDIVQLLWNLGLRRYVLDHSLGLIKTKPDAGSLNTAAWIMAIDPGELRNPSEALKYAKKACALTNYKNPKMLDTLAAAYAADGQFSKAIETIDKAIELGAGTEENSWLREVEKRKALYQENKPYFEKAKIIKQFY